MMFDTTTQTSSLRIRFAMKQIVDLNNHGVNLLVEGRLVSALNTLYQATGHIQQVLEAQAQLAAASPERVSGSINTTQRLSEVCYVTPLTEENIQLYSTSGSTSEGEWQTTTTRTTTALSSLSSTSSLSQPVNTPRNYSNDFQSHLRHESQPNQSLSMMCTNVTSAPYHEPETQSTRSRTLYSFLRPILFSAEDFLQAKNPPITQLRVCLLFNLAIVNHKLALLSPPMDRWMPLNEAIYLYRVAHQLQIDEMVEVSRLHTLGILNNLGQLYDYAKMDAASNDCFRTLLEMITVDQVRHSTSIPNTGLPAAMESLQAPYMEHFLGNIFEVLGSHPYTCKAAAAA